jgi:O-antigen/teichoic acid export membrane protein
MLKAILTVGVIQVVAILISIARSKMVALLLGPEGLGIVSVIDQVVQLVAYISAFSLPLAAVRFLSRAHSEGEGEFQRTYSLFLSIILTLSSVGALAGVAIALWRPQLLGPELFEFNGVLAIAVLAVPAMILGGFIPNALAAARKVRASALMAVVTSVGLTFAWVGGILLGGLPGMYIGSVAMLTAIALGALIYLRASLGLPLIAKGINIVDEFKANPQIFGMAAILAAGSIASSCALLVMRQSVLTTEGPAAAGLLQSAYALALAINLVLNPTNGLYLTPIMNRNIDKREKLATAIAYQKRLAAILVLVGLPVVLFPKTLLFVLFSGDFTDAGQWVFLFATAQVAAQFAGIYQAILIGVDDLWRYGVVTCAGFGVVGFGSWLLVGALGVEGAGIAILAGAVFTAVAALVVLHGRHGLKLSMADFSLTLYAVLSCLIVGMIAKQLPEWGLAPMAARAGVGAVFVLGMWILVDASDRAYVYDLLKRKMTRSAST